MVMVMFYTYDGVFDYKIAETMWRKKNGNENMLKSVEQICV